MNGWDWTQGAVFLAGCALTILFKVGYLRVRGIRVKVPYIDRSDASLTLAIVVISVLSLVTIVQTQANANNSEDCARQFRDALTYNAGLNVRTADIAAQRNAEFDKLLQAVFGNSSLPDMARSQANADAIKDYRTRIATLDRERSKTIDSRATYPDPTCGRS